MTRDEFIQLALAVPAVSEAAAEEARSLEDQLTKPRGALGELETLGIQLAAIARTCPPPVPEPVVVAVFAGDHGVVETGVTPWPSEVTAQMVANFCAGGAAINVLARHAGADVLVVDVGVATDIPGDQSALLRRNVAKGTANLATSRAMTSSQVDEAISVGVDVALSAHEGGARLLVTGEMGIGNTTAAAALLAAITGADARSVTGRGTGVDDETLALKIRVIENALTRLGTETKPLEVLAEVGGLEIAALVGFIIQGAALGIPVIIDGVISVAAAVIAAALAAQLPGYLIGGHLSSEPGAGIGLAHLGVSPVLDLSLRLGEGSGAALAIPLVQAAAKILREMARFDDAGVVDKDHVK